MSRPIEASHAFQNLNALDQATVRRCEHIATAFLNVMNDVLAGVDISGAESRYRGVFDAEFVRRTWLTLMGHDKPLVRARFDVMQAIACAATDAPGPDGLPFMEHTLGERTRTALVLFNLNQPEYLACLDREAVAIAIQAWRGEGAVRRWEAIREVVRPLSRGEPKSANDLAREYRDAKQPRSSKRKKPKTPGDPERPRGTNPPSSRRLSGV